MPKQRTSRPRTLASGRLRIGDEWNAIEIIASTQTHPLKAICELAENALDAGARDVAIVRRRTHGDVFLEVIDDGKGVARDADGLPDFTRIATHVCDSMKRHLAEQDRRGIHGEFGIGLLSFWSLGETLRMISAGADGNLYEMQLDRGNRTYTVRPVRGQIPSGGTRVIVGPLLPATRNIVTGEKLQRYLSEELRDRIRSTGASVRILDHLSHKQLLVEPREFSGNSSPSQRDGQLLSATSSPSCTFNPTATARTAAWRSVRTGRGCCGASPRWSNFSILPGPTRGWSASLISGRLHSPPGRAAESFPTSGSWHSSPPCRKSSPPS